MKKFMFVAAAFLFAFATVVQAQSPTPKFGSVTVEKTVEPSIVLNTSTTGGSVNSIIGKQLGANQWRLGLGGSSAFDYFQLQRFVSGNAVDVPLKVENATGYTTVTGSNFQVNDVGRTSQNDNAPAMAITSTEGVGYPTYVTNYGLIVNRRMTATGKGDRIGGAFIQTCDATLPGHSCVGSSGFAVAGGEGKGNYTGSNPRVLVPNGLVGGGNAIGQEVNTETHSPVGLKYGLLIGDLNQAGPDNSTTAGSTIDTAVMIATQPIGSELAGFNCTTCGHTNGITFGEASAGYPQTFSIRAGGTLIQAAHPSRVLNYGLDLTGMGGGFTYGALAMPINKAKNGIVWGYNRAGGIITSTAVSTGPQMTFTDNGLFIQTSVGGSMLGLTTDGRLQAPLQTPASSAAACSVGQFMNDANFHYVCVATNTWKRAALTAF